MAQEFLLYVGGQFEYFLRISKMLAKRFNPDNIRYFKRQLNNTIYLNVQYKPYSTNFTTQIKSRYLPKNNKLIINRFYRKPNGIKGEGKKVFYKFLEHLVENNIISKNTAIEVFAVSLAQNRNNIPNNTNNLICKVYKTMGFNEVSNCILESSVGEILNKRRRSV
jgi:hypothetical protein